MVVIHLKKDDANQFLYECTTKMTNDDLIKDLVQLWNMRMVLGFLVDNARALAKHGPMKPPEQHGLDEIAETEQGVVVEKGPHYAADPQGQRSGNGPGPQLAETIERVCLDALAAINKNQVDLKVALTHATMQEKMDNIRGAVTMAYPMGLPEHDVIREIFEANDPYFMDSNSGSADLFEPETATLWWAGKEFVRGETVANRVGRNEKTKVVCKMQNKGQGPPGREPAVTESERNAMMAHYFKKQEEMKKLAEADDDDFHSSVWSSSNQMKDGLRGTGNVRAF